MKKSIKILAGLTCATALAATAYAASGSINLWLNVLSAGKEVVKTIPDALVNAQLSAVSFRMQTGTSEFESLALDFAKRVSAPAVSNPAFLNAVVGVVNASGKSDCKLLATPDQGNIATVMCHKANAPEAKEIAKYALALQDGNHTLLLKRVA